VRMKHTNCSPKTQSINVYLPSELHGHCKGNHSWEYQGQYNQACSTRRDTFTGTPHTHTHTHTHTHHTHTHTHSYTVNTNESWFTLEIRCANNTKCNRLAHSIAQVERELLVEFRTERHCHENGTSRHVSQGFLHPIFYQSFLTS